MNIPFSRFTVIKHESEKVRAVLKPYMCIEMISFLFHARRQLQCFFTR